MVKNQTKQDFIELGARPIIRFVAEEEGDFLLNLVTKIIQLGKYGDFKFDRFGSQEESESFIATRLKEFLNQSDVRSYLTTFDFSCSTLEECLKSKETVEVYNFFFNDKFSEITSDFYSLLDSHSLILRQRLIQTLSLYYRLNGRINIDEISEIDRRIKAGDYEIQVSAIDKHGNQTTKPAKLNITRPERITAPELGAQPTYVNGIMVVNKKHPLPVNYAPGENLTAGNAVRQMRGLI